MNRRGRHARLPLLIAILFLLALIPFALFRGSQVPEAEAAWWNESWKYRQSIAVTNNTTQQTNVYISVSLDTSDTSKFQDDCGDLRFTKQNGQLLPYYIVSGCGTASTSIHVQLDTFPAGAQTFYAYYGNPSADNGFSSADFLIAASSYTVGGIGSEETGPGPVAYWKFDEGSGSVVYDSANHSMSNELLADGDMEAADTSDWTATTSTLSKETSDPYSGSNSLRVSNSAAPTHAWARQTIVTTGKRYKVSGYAKSDGVNTPLVYSGGARWTGTTATSWQAFDVEYRMPAGTTISFGAYNMTTGGYVEFDDISVREIGPVNQGTISGATWANEDQCVSGECLTFDGTDDYVTMGNIEGANFTSSDAFTLSVWVNPSTIGESGYVVGKNGIGKGYALYWAGANDAIALASGVNYAEYVSDPVFTEHGTWVHVTAVFDSGNVSYYKNGQPSGTYAGHSFVAPTSDESVIIGNRNGGGVAATYFAGHIDEVKIFPYALTEEQIKAEYNLGSAAVMGTGSGVAPPAGGTLSDSLVAHWAFDEQYGQTAHDKVSNNHGTFGASTSPGSDDPTWTAAGECKVNGCLGFDGGDHVDAGNSASLNIQNLFTATAWIKTTSTQSTIISKKDTSPYPGYSIRVSTGVIAVHLAGADQWKSGTTIVNDGHWHHVAWTYDGITSTIFVDGKLDATHAMSTTTTPSTNFYIGKTAFDATNFNGLIDEVKIYNTALTADQIKLDMNAGASVAYSVGSEEADELADGAGAPPIAEWTFDEKQGTVAYDSSGNANDGTVNGAAWKSGCKQGACLEFDGVDDYVDGFNTPTMQNFSVSAWVKHAGGNDDIVLGSTHSRWLKLFFVSPTQIRLWSYDGADNYYTWDVPDLTNQWRHLELIYDSNTGYTTLYHNGDNIGSKTITASSIQVPFRFIGAQVGGSTAYSPFNGQIDHVKIYDYARTPAQIAYDYNRGAPVAHWKFDECEGTVAHDASGNENHGTINIGASGTQTTAGTCSTSGSWANGASGKFEGSLNFDGTDDYVCSDTNGDGTCDDNDSLDITGQQTISAWVKTTDGSGHLVGKGSNANFKLVIGLGGGVQGFRPAAYVSSGDATYNNSIAVNDNQWHHIVGVYIASTSTTLYVDGKQVAQDTTITNNVTNTTDPFTIGYNTTFSNYALSGQIDDVRIYNYALSPAQVQKVYNQGFGVRYGPTIGQ